MRGNGKYYNPQKTAVKSAGSKTNLTEVNGSEEGKYAIIMARPTVISRAGSKVKMRNRPTGKQKKEMMTDTTMI